MRKPHRKHLLAWLLTVALLLTNLPIPVLSEEIIENPIQAEATKQDEQETIGEGPNEPTEPPVSEEPDESPESGEQSEIPTDKDSPALPDQNESETSKSSGLICTQFSGHRLKNE